jgi:hypothetical protein
LKVGVRRDCDVSRADMIWLEVGRKEALSRAAAFDEIRRFTDAHGSRKALDRVGEIDGDQLYVNGICYSG